jgi:hypothetical protein
MHMHTSRRARPSLEHLESRLSPASLHAFSLVDLSPTSPTSGQVIDPANYRGEVSAYYFMNPG